MRTISVRIACYTLLKVLVAFESVKKRAQNNKKRAQNKKKRKKRKEKKE
jgi:hypothetical protein